MAEQNLREWKIEQLAVPATGCLDVADGHENCPDFIE
jgi:hypothetical protein